MWKQLIMYHIVCLVMWQSLAAAVIIMAVKEVQLKMYQKKVCRKDAELFSHNMIPLYCTFVHNVLYYPYICIWICIKSLIILTYKLTWKVFSKSYQASWQWKSFHWESKSFSFCSRGKEKNVTTKLLKKRDRFLQTRQNISSCIAQYYYNTSVKT